jgi:hypothetical protein
MRPLSCHETSATDYAVMWRRVVSCPITMTKPRLENSGQLCISPFRINHPSNTRNCLLQKGCTIKLGSVERRGDVVKCCCYGRVGVVQSVAQPFPRTLLLTVGSLQVLENFNTYRCSRFATVKPLACSLSFTSIRCLEGGSRAPIASLGSLNWISPSRGWHSCLMCWSSGPEIGCVDCGPAG